MADEDAAPDEGAAGLKVDGMGNGSAGGEKAGKPVLGLAGRLSGDHSGAIVGGRSATTTFV